MSFKKAICSLWTTACLVHICLCSIHIYNVMPYNFAIKHAFLENHLQLKTRWNIQLEWREGTLMQTVAEEWGLQRGRVEGKMSEGKAWGTRPLAALPLDAAVHSGLDLSLLEPEPQEGPCPWLPLLLHGPKGKGKVWQVRLAGRGETQEEGGCRGLGRQHWRRALGLRPPGEK